MALVPAHKILAHARNSRYGIPCLLAGDLQMLVGQVRAAESARAPLILAFNEAVTPDIPMELAMPAMVSASQNSAVPIATILDHGGSLESAIRAIELGSSSVMYDGSALPYEENVRNTAEVVRVAHAAGVSVEGELGAVGGSSVELGRSDSYASSLTDPALAVEYVERSGVDVLAISFGNAHGIYRGRPDLDLALVRQIAQMVDVPLAMHGASGLALEEYGPIVDSGISKVNYYTAMARSVSHRLREWLGEAAEDEIVYHRIISTSIEGFQAETQRLLHALRCSGQAASP
jgi:fructose-bisphosphate aldolase, class II